MGSVLAACTANWTLVTAPLILFTDESNEIVIITEDCPGKKINASDIAAFLISQLSDSTYNKKSPFIANR